MGGNNRLGHMTQDIPANGVLTDLQRMLCRDDNGVHPHRRTVPVFHRHLRFSVRSKIGQQSAPAHFRKAPGQIVGKVDGQGHEILGFIGGIAEHHALIARAVAKGTPDLCFEGSIHTQGNVGGLAIQRYRHSDGIRVKSAPRAGVPNLANCVPHDGLNIHGAGSGNLAHDEHYAGGGGNLAGHPRRGVFGEDSVKNGVGNLVAKLVGMPLGDRFRSK